MGYREELRRKRAHGRSHAKLKEPNNDERTSFVGHLGLHGDNV